MTTTVETIDLTPTKDEQANLISLFVQDIALRKVRKASQKDAAALLESIVGLAFTLGANAGMAALNDKDMPGLLRARSALVEKVTQATR